MSKEKVGSPSINEKNKDIQALNAVLGILHKFDKEYFAISRVMKFNELALFERKNLLTSRRSIFYSINLLQEALATIELYNKESEFPVLIGSPLVMEAADIKEELEETKDLLTLVRDSLCKEDALLYHDKVVIFDAMEKLLRTHQILFEATKESMLLVVKEHFKK